MAATRRGGRTVLVFGDQLNRRLGALADAEPDRDQVLIVESAGKISGRRWHRQRLHLVVTAMRRFALELRSEGFRVDHRESESFTAGVAAHRDEYAPDEIVATEPNSRAADAWCGRMGITRERSDQFLCHRDEFATFATDRRRLVMEDFYRAQRRRFGYLMDGDEPAGGVWNLDHENREPLPKGLFPWPEPVRHPLDDLDHAVTAAFPAGLPGADPAGWWPTSRDQALAQLEHVVTEVAPIFGPYEDAMSAGNWHLAHTLLSAPLNLGLLLPGEVLDRVEEAYRAGQVPLASAEGLVRQILGWREFIWGMYWWKGEEYATRNDLGARRSLPAAFVDGTPTGMRCLDTVLADVEAQGWTHHIARLVVLGNLALTAGIDPQALTAWMHERFVDGADWVMVPNVIGMACYADGGELATKPYAVGGAYIDRMSDFCGECRFDRTRRVGPGACPFTTLYWAFLDEHRERLLRNPRVARQVRAFERLRDAEGIGVRAADVRAGLAGSCDLS
ncbi:MAG: cryptochrome/photolyase family protein [Actinomycetota bacterium]